MLLMSIVLIDNETICWAYCMSIRPTGFILFVKHTNCGGGHLLWLLIEMYQLSGYRMALGAVSYILPQHISAMSKYAAYPSVVMVTMVYQNEAGMEVNVESDSLC